MPNLDWLNADVEWVEVGASEERVGMDWIASLGIMEPPVKNEMVLIQVEL